MAGSKFGVSPQIPARIIGIAPIVVEKTGLTYAISFAGGGPDSVTRRQWFSAVADLYNMATLLVAVNADPNDAAWIQFNAGYTVEPGDDLANLTQITFSLSPSQMLALFALARTLTP